jgi:4-hydroxybenzoate polyprenyltransferase
MDIKSDTINKKHLLLAEGLLSVKNAYIEFIVLLVISAILIVRLSPLYIIFILLSFLFGIVYSVPPIKFKDRPILDFMINAVGYGFVNFSLGWVIQKPFSIQTVVNSLPYVFAVGAIFVNTTILDIEGDKQAGSRTTGIFLGQGNALRLSTILIVICVIVSILLRDWVCFIPSVIALPIFVVASLKQNINYIFLSIGIGGPLLILITGLIFPYFLILFVLVFIFLRLYYKHRFGINYPSLSSSH